MPQLKPPVSSKDHIQGNPNAPLILVEYGDYQCPYCGMAYQTVKQLQERFGEELQFVFRNFPLAEVHPLAETAAETAEFAAVHGRFWEMHDLLYENQQMMSLELFIELTGALQLPKREYTLSIENRTYADRVRTDFLSGVHSGVNGTPTFYINGQRHNESYEFEQLALSLENFRC